MATYSPEPLPEIWGNVSQTVISHGYLITNISLTLSSFLGGLSHNPLLTKGEGGEVGLETVWGPTGAWPDFKAHLGWCDREQGAQNALSKSGSLPLPACKEIWEQRNSWLLELATCQHMCSGSFKMDSSRSQSLLWESFNWVALGKFLVLIKAQLPSVLNEGRNGTSK